MRNSPVNWFAKTDRILSLLTWLAILSGLAYGQTSRIESSRSTATLAAAQRAADEADKLKAEWKSESFRLAAGKYASAQKLFHLSGERRREAEVLEKLGEVSALLSDYQGAILHYNQALPLLKDEQLQVLVLTKLGDAYLEMADVRNALPQCDRALGISERLNFDQGTALALNCLGVANSIASDVSQAQDYFERALAIARTIGDERDRSRAMESLAPHMPGGLLGEALVIARAISGLRIE